MLSPMEMMARILSQAGRTCSWWPLHLRCSCLRCREFHPSPHGRSCLSRCRHGKVTEESLGSHWAWEPEVVVAFPPSPPVPPPATNATNAATGGREEEREREREREKKIIGEKERKKNPIWGTILLPFGLVLLL